MKLNKENNHSTAINRRTVIARAVSLSKWKDLIIESRVVIIRCYILSKWRGRMDASETKYHKMGLKSAMSALH